MMNDKNSLAPQTELSQAPSDKAHRLTGNFKKRLKIYLDAQDDPAFPSADFQILKAQMIAYCEEQYHKLKSLETVHWYGYNLAGGWNGLDRDIQKGIQFLQKSADQGYVKSHSELGNAYLGYWLGTEYRDYAKAKHHYSCSDTPYDKYRLGQFHYYGWGCEKDTKLGMSILKEAAALGEVRAYYEIGWIYYGQEKYDDAFRYFCEMYRLRHKGLRSGLAQYYIGLCYHEGHGVEEDKARGLKSIKYAADLGCTEAKKWLEDKNENKPKVFDTKKKDTSKSSNKDAPVKQALEKPLNFIDFNQKSSQGVHAPVQVSVREDKILSKEDLNVMLAVFDQYVGLEDIQEQIRSLFYMTMNAQRRKAAGIEGSVKPSLHMVFKGNPGTGKTVVARIMGDLLHKMGYLSKGHLVEVDRSKLVGPYIGWSERNTEEALKKAAGGVLFIDEAYDLDKPLSWNDFGREIIAKLVKSMEDQRENLVIIMAGYSEHMEFFLDSNPGLRSRIAIIIDFPDYKDAELVEIFERYCAEKKYVLDPLAKQKLEKIMRVMRPGKKDKFGNARGIRNLFEATLRLQAKRVVETDVIDVSGLSLILAADIPGENRPSGGDEKVTYLSQKS